MRQIFYYISGHGFGHAVRSAQVVRALYQHGFQCAILSSAPESIFACNLRGIPYVYRRLQTDIGVRQRGALEVDLPATLRAWQEFLAGEDRWMEGQLRWIREMNPEAIVSDIAPLAFPLARRAGLPSFLLASFTWDWILGYYREDDPGFQEMSVRLREYYLSADRLIFTPLSYGLPPVQPRHRVPLIGKRSSFTRDELRLRLGLDNRDAFLISFGGFGLNDMKGIGMETMTDYQFLFLADREEVCGNVRTFHSGRTAHEDLVAVSRAVVTKPGYGIASEAILNRVPMIHTSRGRFAEYEPLAAEIREYIPASFISREALFNGGLRAFLEDPPQCFKGLRRDPGAGAKGAAAVISGALDRQERRAADPLTY